MKLKKTIAIIALLVMEEQHSGKTVPPPKLISLKSIILHSTMNSGSVCYRYASFLITNYKPKKKCILNDKCIYKNLNLIKKLPELIYILKK